MTSSTPASERVREGWESVPADSETQVDYPKSIEEYMKQLEQKLQDHGIELPPEPVSPASPYLSFDLPPTLAVEMVIGLPDGRSYTFREEVEYERDGNGEIDFEFEDAGGVIETVARSAHLRFE
jgi:hypothetical protein